MKITNVILIIFCNLVIGCNSSEETYFPNKETLKPKLMPLEGLVNPFRIEIKSPFLVFENLRRTDSLYHIYDLKSHEFKSSFGIKGEGPEDFVFPWLYQTQTSEIFIGDIGKNLLYKFTINEEGEAKFKGTDKQNYMNAAFINDSLYIADAMFEDPCIYLLSLQDNMIKKSWQYRNPEIKDYYKDIDKGQIYANNNRIVFCYEYKKQIDFMDADFNQIKRIEFKFPYPENIDSDNLQDIKTSYGTGYLGKRYFYALFLGRSSIEFKDISFREAFLEVFDLDGNPVARYHLDGLSPTYFAIDEETFTLYGVRDDGEPENNLLLYKLKGLS